MEQELISFINPLYFRSVEVKQPAIDWSVLVPLISNFSENFSPEQVRLHPLACKG